MPLFSTNWEPWRELEQLQREMNRIFSDYSDRRRSPGRGRPEFPPVNHWQSEDGVLLTAEIPGLKPEALDVTVTGSAVTIRGRREPESLPEGGSYERQERWSEPFVRTIELPYDVDAQNAEATHEKGIFALKLNRPEEQKPKKVKVKAG